MNKDLISYYKQRALEYEKIYSKPERQEDLKRLGQLLQKTFANKKVLEIACGTGYWTEQIAHTADSIVATDINTEVLEVAKQKQYSKNNVSFQSEDLYNRKTEHKFEALFAGFIWSHVKLEDLPKFIAVLNASVLPGSTIVIVDNTFVKGSNLPITETDEQGNTYQSRELSDGSKHRVLKNFPTRDFLRSTFAGHSSEFNLTDLTYYWLLTYKTPLK